MAIDDKIRNEKLQHDINREAAKVPALSSGKVNKYEYLTGEEVLHFKSKKTDATRQFYIFSIRKSFWKTKKKDWKTLERHLKSELKKVFRHWSKINCFFILKDFLHKEATYELKKFLEIKNKLNRDNLIYKTGNKKNDKTFDFQKFETIRSFGREIYNNDLSIDDTFEKQID